MYPKPFYTFNALLISTIVITSAYIFSSPLFPIKTETKISWGYPKDSLLNFTELTAIYGYISEEHKVITDDGYILTVFRIIRARNCKVKVIYPPVLLMHGLLQSSDSWIDSGPDSGLAYLIADACFDLWVGNVRGNYYSRRHIHLDPDKDSKFWDFDIDKIGIYDVPAMIDYILDYTETKKLNYIGFSQGTGTFLVMCSERPGYCEKVNLVIGLAPAARQINTKSRIYRGLTQSLEKMESALSKYGIQEVLSKGSFSQEFVAFFCQLTDRTSSICETFIKLFDYVDSFHSGSISNVTVKVLFGHFPAGTSLHNMAKYGQSMKSNQFEKFDYGKERNLVVYGSEYPPIYNLSAVTVPLVCIYGKNDGLVDSEDVKWLVSQLPNVIDSIEVEDPFWNHFDVSYSQYTREMIFSQINDYLLKYSNT